MMKKFMFHPARREGLVGSEYTFSFPSYFFCNRLKISERYIIIRSSLAVAYLKTTNDSTGTYMVVRTFASFKIDQI